MRFAWFRAALIAHVIAISSAGAQTPPPLQRLPADVVPAAYDLSLTIEPNQNRFSGEARIALTLTKPTTAFTINARDLRFTKASLAPDGGAEITATVREDSNNPGWARVSLAAQAPSGKAVLTIAYTAAFTNGQTGLYLKRSIDGAPHAFTQMQPAGARRVFPSFDEPRFKTPYTVAVTARAGDVVVANGPQLKTEPLRDGRVRHVFATTEPLPTYLIAFAVGPFEVVEAKPLPKTPLRAREIPLRGIAMKGGGRYFGTALASTRAFIEWFEDYFATPYPYAKLDLIAEPDKPGAMENAGAITYAERLILLAPDASIANRRSFATIHAHELAHQWLGNLVTPVWWDDIWLNESFATWMSHRATGAVMPELGLDRASLRNVTRSALSIDALRGAKPVRRPLRTEADLLAAFDFVTYSKGGAVVAMVEDYVGRERFRDAMRAYVARHPHANTTAKDLYAALEQSTGDRQLGAAFESFIGQAHAPVVTGATSCKGSQAGTSASQRTYSPLGWSLPDQRWLIPLCATPFAATGAGARACTMMAERETTLALAGGSCPKLVSLNSGAAYFHQARDAAAWKTLAAELSLLPAGEQSAAIDDLGTAFASNGAEAHVVLEVLARAAAATETSLLTRTVLQVQGLEKSVPEDAVEAYRVWVRSTLTGAFAQAVKRRDQAELTGILLRALALNGRDPAIRARLAEAARTMMGPLRLASSVPRDLALRIAIEDGGPETFANLLAMAKASDDIVFRWDALRALGRATRAEDRAAFAAALKDFEPLLVGFVLLDLASDPATAPFAWATVKSQFDDLTAREPLMAQVLPYFARGLCSAEGRADLVAFADAKRAKLKDHEALLSQSIDEIDHCAALRGVQGPPLANALRAGTKVAARRDVFARRQEGMQGAFDQLSIERAGTSPVFGDVVSTCGRKFPQTSPLEICAVADAPRACRDIRLMVEQCLGR